MNTKRLILRTWQQEDLEPFSRLNQDPRTMEFLLAPLTLKESEERMAIYRQHIEDHGWGFWAVSLPGIADFIGWIGLGLVNFDSHFTPAIEVGWRLLPDFWGQGYATEGAKAALDYGFETLDLNEIVSITVPANTRSKRVMEKLRMHRDPKEDFDHPKVPLGHPLKRHYLYRLQQAEWRTSRDAFESLII